MAVKRLAAGGAKKCQKVPVLQAGSASPFRMPISGNKAPHCLRHRFGSYLDTKFCPPNKQTARSARKHCEGCYQFMRNLWITCPFNWPRRTGLQPAGGQKTRAKTRMDAGKLAPVPSTPSSGGCRRGRNFRGRAWRVGPGAREVPAPAGFRFSPLRPGAVQARLTASFGSAHSGPAWPGSPRIGSAWFGLASPHPGFSPARFGSSGLGPIQSGPTCPGSLCPGPVRAGSFRCASTHPESARPAPPGGLHLVS